MTRTTISLTTSPKSVRRLMNRRCYLQPTVSTIVTALWFIPVQTSAQNAAPSGMTNSNVPMKVIAIEVTDEVRNLRAGKADNPFAAITTAARNAGPEAADSERFLAAIDVSKLDSNVVGGDDTARSAVATVTVDTLEAQTTYDGEGARATTFETRYDQLNATLQCHWSYDSTISSRLAELDAKAKEAELEQSFEAERSGPDAAPGPDTSEPPKDADPEFDFVFKERQFTKAGRPCLLTVACEDEQDPRCSEKFLDDVVKSVVLVREGAK